MSLLEDRIKVRQAEERKNYFKNKFIADSLTLKAHHPMLTDNDTAFLVEELTAIEAKIIEHKPTETSFRNLFKVVNLGAGLKSIDYQELMRSGQSKYIAYGETDVPLASVKRNSVPNPVRMAGIKYTFQLQDIAYMQRSGFNLDMQSALAAKEGNEHTLNNTTFFGAKEIGLKGYFTWAKDGFLSVITPGAGAGVGADNTWATKTAEEIFNGDIRRLKNSGRENTKKAIDYNVLAVGIAAYGELETKCFSLGGVPTSETVLDRILSKRMFDRVEMCPELDDVTVTGLVSSKAVAIAFSDREDVFTRHIPLELTSIPLQIQGFTHTVHMYCDDGGLFCYRKYGGAYLLDV